MIIANAISTPISLSSLPQGSFGNFLSKQDPELLLIFGIIVVCILCTILILSKNIFVRLKKQKIKATKEPLIERYEQFLSELASGDYEDEAFALMSANKETTLSLLPEDHTLRLNRETLLEALLALHRELLGESAIKLREVYLIMGFKAEGLKKLRSRNWKHRVGAIQELVQMEILDAYPPIFEMVNDANKLVRMESILARIGMDSSPVAFLNEIEYELNEYEQLRIHAKLRTLPLSSIPSFKPFLYADKSSVQQFSVRMIGFFNQADAESALLVQLKTAEPNLQTEIVASLKQIGSQESVEFLIAHFNDFSAPVQVAILEALTVLSGSDAMDFFLDCLDAPHYEVKLEAARSLQNIGEAAQGVLDNIKQTTPEKTDLIEHAKTWSNS